MHDRLFAGKARRTAAEQVVNQGVHLFSLVVHLQLIQLSKLQIRSYLEIGIRHGGSFVATVEVLDRFSQLDFAIALDVIPCPSMTDYKAVNPRTEFACINTLSADCSPWFFSQNHAA
jgi:hypothetical protein